MRDKKIEKGWKIIKKDKKMTNMKRKKVERLSKTFLMMVQGLMLKPQ